MKRYRCASLITLALTSILVVFLCLSYNDIERQIKDVKKDSSKLVKQSLSYGFKLQQFMSKMSHQVELKKNRKQNVGHANDLRQAKYPNLLTNDNYFVELKKQLLKDFKSKGNLNFGVVGRPNSLNPFNNFSRIAEWNSLCILRVAKSHVGKYSEFAPNAASKVELRPRADNPEEVEFWIHLRPDIYWEPIDKAFFPKDQEISDVFLKRCKVTADDFKFYYDVANNPYVSELGAAGIRAYLGDIEEFKVINDQTFVIRWKHYSTSNNSEKKKMKFTALRTVLSLRPLPKHIFSCFSNGQKIVEESSPNIYRESSVWGKNFSVHWCSNWIVSCGAYKFAGITDEAVTLKKNINYHNPYEVLVNSVSYRFKDSADSVLQDFKKGLLNVTYLSPMLLKEWENFTKTNEYKQQVKQGFGATLLPYYETSYTYIGLNCKSKLFEDRNIRIAMNMAVDRKAMLYQLLNNEADVITGPFYCGSASYNKDVLAIPFDREEAKRLLTNAGWVDRDGDGIREKIIDGKVVKFSFHLNYYVKSVMSRNVALYFQAAYKEIGVDCTVFGVELADISQKMFNRSFEAISMGWAFGSFPEDIRNIWHSAGVNVQGSSNYISYENKEVDALIDELDFEYDPVKRKAIYGKFHELIYKDSPYIFLFSPKLYLIYRDNTKNIFIAKDAIPGGEEATPNIEHIWLENQKK